MSPSQDNPLSQPAWVRAWRGLEPARRAPVVRVAEKLGEKGYRGWLVGGAVRDLVLGLTPGDLDMVSEATPDQALEVFPNALPMGKAFGIVRVPGLGELSGEAHSTRGRESGSKEPGKRPEPIELATFRMEEGYSDGRRPDRVRFTQSLEEDAMRRDFTCNALYFDPLNEELQDPAGGIVDLEQGILRTVGEARDRFAEDGLRLLRVVRFLARFDFEPAPGLLEAAHRSRESLRGVSSERILGEFTRMAESARADKAMRALQVSGLFGFAFTAGREMDWPDEKFRVGVAGRLSEENGRLGALLWMLLGCDPYLESNVSSEVWRASCKVRLADLGPPTQIQTQVLEMCAWRRALFALPPIRELGPMAHLAIRILRVAHGGVALKVAQAVVAQLVSVDPADSEVSDARGRLSQLQAWFDELPQSRIQPDFLPNGKRWMEAGLQAGPGLGRCMRLVEDAALRGEVRNEREALDWWFTHRDSED